MKKVLYTFLLIFPAFIYAQQAPKTVPVIQKGEKTENKADTIISKDPLDPSREYIIILNFKGVMTEQGTKVSGRKDGVWREYSNGNGLLSKVTEYKMGRKHGACITFSVIGQATLDESYVNDTLQGKRTTYLSNGRIKTTEYFVNGILTGEKKSYYEDTKIQEEAFYKNGVREGVSKWYKQNGKTTLEYSYKNGELQGPAKEYDDNGVIKREGNYISNNEEGEWKVYEDSVLVKKVIYKGGQIFREIPVKK
ncbi:MAG: toxin-antitoxin system YwqK family antitoxin [Bacteroidetes bacterium]|nr:toxin-antitoxin system YwqK family antitoxin [Bacteroidota bacterium]